MVSGSGGQPHVVSLAGDGDDQTGAARPVQRQVATAVHAPGLLDGEVLGHQLEQALGGFRRQFHLSFAGQFDQGPKAQGTIEVEV